MIKQTLEMTINILDNDVVKYYKDSLNKKSDGIELSVFNSESKQLYNGIVWPND